MHKHTENFPNQLETVSIPTSNVLMKTRVFKKYNYLGLYVLSKYYVIAIAIVTKDHLSLSQGLRLSACQADVITIHYRNLNYE